VKEVRLPRDDTFFAWLNDAQMALQGRTTGAAGGFRGGWVGWFTYEMKEESLAGYRGPACDGERVDSVWAWVDTLVERAEDGGWTVRGVVSDGGATGGSELLDWLAKSGVSLGASKATFDAYTKAVEDVIASPPAEGVTPATGFPTFRPRISGEAHMSRIDACREAIRQGESYELNQTMSFLASLDPADAYATYLRLRSFNPAYYSTFMCFPTIPTPKGMGLHVLSSSPERFLQITGGEIEMRPIKGTARRVQPGQCVCVEGRGCGGQEKGSAACLEEGEHVDFERGRVLSEDKKERAENLMVS
jgi:para-aminobenzoate synthetase